MILHNMILTAKLAPVDEIISLIYEGPMQDRPWQSFLRLLRLRMGVAVSALAMRPGGQGITPVVIVDRSYEITKADAKRVAKDYALLIHLDPLGNALQESGDAFILDELISPSALQQNPFFQTVMQPANLTQHIGMCFTESQGWKCHIRLMNTPDKPPFDDSDKQFLLDLRPHLERALALYARLKHSQSEKAMFRDTLDRLTIGAFVLDATGRVLDSNDVAHYIANRSGVVTLDNKIRFIRHEDNLKFSQLVNEALAWRETHTRDSFVEIMRLATPDGSNLDILIRAVPPPDRYQTECSPSVIVYIEDNLQHHLPPEKIIGKLFGLTPTEAYLSTLLANGFTLAEAANTMDVTENTARSYSKRIFVKTGVKRQADLVRVILKSVALLA